MRFFICAQCNIRQEVAGDKRRRPVFCSPCRKSITLGKIKTETARRKALHKKLTGGEGKSDWIARVNELAICSRQGTAAMLGVSEELIRMDELHIIKKIRSECGELAAECGFPNVSAFHKAVHERKQAMLRD